MRSDGSSRGPRPANECFVCGPDNPIGLHLIFRLEDGACVSEFTPGPNHVGYPGVVHGGIIYSALDDVMANWLYLRGARAYTARCEIRYREPAAPGDKLLLAGRPTARRRRLVEMEATATRVRTELPKQSNDDPIREQYRECTGKHRNQIDRQCNQI